MKEIIEDYGETVFWAGLILLMLPLMFGALQAFGSI